MSDEDLVIPVPGDGDGDQQPQPGGDEMPDLFDQNLAQIAQLGVQLQQTGIIAQNNFVTLQKALDYDFMENRRMITLEEGVGVREVASTQVPAGPTPRT